LQKYYLFANKTLEDQNLKIVFLRGKFEFEMLYFC